jgi:hypothetical protein
MCVLDQKPRANFETWSMAVVVDGEGCGIMPLTGECFIRSMPRVTKTPVFLPPQQTHREPVLPVAERTIE